MSRARKIYDHWFDMERGRNKATDVQLELLAIAEKIDLDDLLDEGLTQGDVVFRLRQTLGEQIPDDVILRRNRWRRERQVAPKCRICQREGDSTKHHFVPKWLLRELEHYQSKWANKNRCTIPLCINCHRDIHFRNESDKSMYSFMTDRERQFAHEAVRALLHERPKIFELLVLGDQNSYEATLIRDWSSGRFVTEEIRRLRLVA